MAAIDDRVDGLEKLLKDQAATIAEQAKTITRLEGELGDEIKARKKLRDRLEIVEGFIKSLVDAGLTPAMLIAAMPVVQQIIAKGGAAGLAAVKSWLGQPLKKG